MGPKSSSTPLHKMAGFPDLSVDLLYVIFGYLKFDKQQLCDLSLTCRLFRDISQRFMVRRTIISHSPTRSHTQLLLRTLKERPDLIPHVHRLELDLLREDIHWPEEQANIRRITLLLTNLREFCYLSRDYKVWHYDLEFPLIPSRENAYENIRRVEWHHNMSIKSLLHCMALPRIESIYCRELHAPADIPIDAFAFTERTSSVIEIGMGYTLGLPCETFRAVLRVPRCLRNLTLDINQQFRLGLEPHQFAYLLEPVQGTLEELHITKKSWLSWRLESLADLSAFHSLRRLSIPFKYIFGAKDQRPPKADRLLPPHLSELKLSFTAAQHPADPIKALDHREALTEWLEGIITRDLPSSTLPDPINIIMFQSNRNCPLPDLHVSAVPQVIRMLQLSDKDKFGRLKIQHQREIEL